METAKNPFALILAEHEGFGRVVQCQCGAIHLGSVGAGPYGDSRPFSVASHSENDRNLPVTSVNSQTPRREVGPLGSRGFGLWTRDAMQEIIFRLRDGSAVIFEARRI
jgi:hypothetical protein